MSEQETRVEITGNIIVHHPIKRDTWVSAMNKAWEAPHETNAISEAELRGIFGLEAA